MTAAENSFEITSIGQIAIVVHDLPKAVEFYRDKLGLRFLYEFPGLAFFDCGGVRIMLSFPENAEFDHPASILYYKVADINQAWRVLEARGVKLEHEPHVIARMPDHDLWICAIRDPENNLVELMSEVKHA
jgi:catechol 2,3-dioxygenase-like lactoylglutathione lyase family enzyme